MEDRPVYNKSVCFEKFPFPNAIDEQKARIRELAERLDAHRKRQQSQHPRLTLTEMYNVLAALREGRELTDAERRTNGQGLVTTLKQIHDELDAAVCAAYNFAPSLTDDELLHALVKLNAERAAEERAGIVRWLRPAYQHQGAAQQTRLDVGAEIALPIADVTRPPFPKTLAEQARAVRLALAAESRVVTAVELSKQFTRAPVDRVTELLETLVSLGQARAVGDSYVA